MELRSRSVPPHRIRLSRTALAFLLAGLLAAPGCGADAPDHASTGVVSDSAGIRVIDLVDLVGVPDPPHRSFEVDPTWLPAFDLEVGRLGDVVPLADGGAVVLDEMAGTLTRLDPAGRVALQFGRPGEGPGEFSPHGGISRVVATDSTLLVPDIQLQRITEFTLSGEILAIHDLPGSGAGDEPVFGVDWRAHPGGGIVFRVLDPGGDRILWFRDAELVTLHVFDLPWPPGNRLLPPTALWDVVEGGDLLLGRSDRGRVERRTPAGGPSPGATEWITRWEGDGGPLTPRDRTHLEDLLLTSAEAQGLGSLPAEERDRIVRSVTLPDSVPVTANVLADPRGRSWVQGAAPIREMGLEAMRVGSSSGLGGTAWRVLAPDGTLEARVELPRGFTARTFVDGCIHGILENDLGVQRPARVCVE